MRTMLTRRSSSPFELFDRLERQLSQQLQTAERVPAAEVHETPEAYEVVLELPGVDKAAIEGQGHRAHPADQRRAPQPAPTLHSPR
jgi:HSP20 family molecular chaperone IbpA